MIKYITVHCSATKEGKEFNSKHIDRWHKDRGFRKIGYHYVILLDGTIEVGRFESEQGAHVKSYNKGNIGICYIGGLDSNGNAKDTRTRAQKESLMLLLKDLKKRYKKAIIKGHRDFSPDLDGDGVIEEFEFIKQCPCFNAKKEYSNL